MRGMTVLKGKLVWGAKTERLVKHRGARWRTIENINEMDCHALGMILLKINMHLKLVIQYMTQMRDSAG